MKDIFLKDAKKIESESMILSVKTIGFFLEEWNHNQKIILIWFVKSFGTKIYTRIFIFCIQMFIQTSHHSMYKVWT